MSGGWEVEGYEWGGGGRWRDMSGGREVEGYEWGVGGGGI